MLQNSNCKNNNKFELNNKDIEKAHILNNKDKGKVGISPKNIKKFENNNNINKPNQDNLKDFISNLKRNFNSAFDHKGAKSFLKSKGKALKEIELNENILDEEDEIKTENKQNVKNRKYTSLNGFNQNFTKESRVNRPSSNKQIKTIKNIKILNNKKHANTISVNTDISDKKSKFKNKKKLMSSKENNFIISNFILKEINIDKKRPKKFYSQVELKMFKDKNLNKLKPIKEKKHFSSKKNNYRNSKGHLESPFDRTDTWKTDSTLFHLVNEIDKI